MRSKLTVLAVSPFFGIFFFCLGAGSCALMIMDRISIGTFLVSVLFLGGVYLYAAHLKRIEISGHGITGPGYFKSAQRYTIDWDGAELHVLQDRRGIRHLVLRDKKSAHRIKIDEDAFSKNSFEHLKRFLSAHAH